MNIVTVAACSRQQVLSNVCISVNDATINPNVRHRAVGGLTGSRTAGALARVCMEQTLHHFKDRWQSFGFRRRVIAGVWVDNVHVASDTPQKALNILNDAEDHLQRYWELTFKPSSKSIMLAQGSDQTCNDPHYALVTRFATLGHILTPTGSCRPCFDATIKAACKQFVLRISPMCFGKLPLQRRLEALKRYVVPVIRYRCSRWSFAKHMFRLLDITQRKMLRITCRVTRLMDESPDVFARRASRLVAATQCEQGFWSDLWAKQVVWWAAHIIRNTKANCLAFNLLDVQSSFALAEVRASNGNRPGTRSSAGWLPVRWTDGVKTALLRLQSKGLFHTVRDKIQDACKHRFPDACFHDMEEEFLTATFLSHF